MEDWNVGHKPLARHYKASLRCKFLTSYNVSNVPIVPPPRIFRITSVPGSMNSSTYKPRHPRMSDYRTRLETYVNWPHISVSAEQLAACGLFYEGEDDITVCFFCGNGINNWESDDVPWNEHRRLYPTCGYVKLVDRHTGRKPYAQTHLDDEIITEACSIFPKALVEKVVTRHLQESSRFLLHLLSSVMRSWKYKGTI